MSIGKIRINHTLYIVMSRLRSWKALNTIALKFPQIKVKMDLQPTMQLRALAMFENLNVGFSRNSFLKPWWHRCFYMEVKVRGQYHPKVYTYLERV